MSRWAVCGQGRVRVTTGAVLMAMLAAGRLPGSVAEAQTQSGAPPIRLAEPEVQDGKGAIVVNGASPAEILSDTQGVDFQPYLRSTLRAIYNRWLQLLPAEAKPPENISGDTAIRFAILPDGTLESMHLDASTHDDRLNRAAWGAVAMTGKFPALPTAFHGPHLALRVHFKVNDQGFVVPK